MDFKPTQDGKESVSPFEKILLNFLLIIFFGALLGIGYVLISHLFNPQEKVALITPLSTTTPTPTSKAILPVFEQILATSCSVPVSKTDTSTIDISLLPLAINQQSLILPQKKAICKGTDSNRYLVLTTQDKSLFYIYTKGIQINDPAISALFTPPAFSKNIDTTDGLSLFSVLQHTNTTTIGQEPVIVWAEKTLQLSGGETVSVSSQTPVIPGDDPRLTRLLSNYAVPSKTNLGKTDVDPGKEMLFENAIKDAFFANMQLLDVPERANILVLKTEFDAFTAK